jgi:hypothetical protein
MRSDSKSIGLELPGMEASVLITHLTEFLNGSRNRIRRMTNRKFELIEIVLFAKFGYKNSGVSGFQKLQPYFTENHWQLIRDILEIDHKVRKMDFSNQYLEKISYQIMDLMPGYKKPYYDSTGQYDALQWKQLEERYTLLGVPKKEAELKKIITDLCDNCP